MCQWSVGVLPSPGMFLLRPSCAQPDSLQRRRRRKRSTCPQLSPCRELPCLLPSGGCSGQGRGVWPPPHSSIEQEIHLQVGVFPDRLVPSLRGGRVPFDPDPPLPPCALLGGLPPVPCPPPDTVPPPPPCSASSLPGPTAGTLLCQADPLAPPHPPRGHGACRSLSLRPSSRPPLLAPGDCPPPPLQPLLVPRDFRLPPDSPHLQGAPQLAGSRQVPRRLKLLLLD